MGESHSEPLTNPIIDLRNPILQEDAEENRENDILTAAWGGGISFAGRIFEYAMRFAFGILVARVAGVEQYGLYTLAITTALIASNIAGLGLHVGMTRFLPPAIRQKDEAAVWGIIQVCVGLPALFSLVLAVGFFLLAGPLANMLFQDPRMVSLLRITSLLILLETLHFMAYTITISFKQPKYGVIANNIIFPLTKLLLAAGFLAVGLSTRGVLVAHVIASAAGLVVLAYYINTLFSFKRSCASSKRNFRQILGYSFPPYLSYIVNTLRSTLSTMVLGLIGLTTGVGVFAAASRFCMIGSMFYLAVGNISTPIVSDLHSRRESSKMRDYYQTTTRWLVMFNLPVFLTAVLFAEPLLAIFGDDFTTGATSMMILAVGTLAYTSTGFGAQILDMTDHPKVNTANSVVMVFVTILLNVLLIPRWGVEGAAVASSASMVLVNLACLVQVWVLLGMQPYNRSFLKPVLAGIGAGLAAYLLNLSLDLPYLLQLIVGGGLLWGVYAAALYLMKLSPEDRFLLERVLSRARVKPSIAQKVAP